MRTTFFWMGTIILTLLWTCRSGTDGQKTGKGDADSAEIIRNREAREDSLELALALEEQSAIEHRLVADVETEPVESDAEEDAADDPAIWVNLSDPASSLVLGTDKKAGIYVYDLEGKVVQSRKIGRINNVDLRDGFPLDCREVVLVAGSNRTTNSVDLMVLEKETGKLSEVLLSIKSDVDEVYGICCYRSIPGNQFYVFVNGKGGALEQWSIQSDGTLDAEMVRTVRLNSQPEGMVADDEAGLLYVGVEQEGIFRLEAEPDGSSGLHKLPGSDDTNERIAYDIEGLALFELEGEPYLIASSQGNFSYALFSLSGDGRYLESFVITAGTVDGVEETDGLDLTTMPLNEQFPRGILVVQDGFNTRGETPESQNFKYVSLEKVLLLLRPDVPVASDQK